MDRKFGEQMTTEIEKMMEAWQQYSDPNPHYVLSEHIFQVARQPNANPLFCRIVTNQIDDPDSNDVPVLQTNANGDRLSHDLKYIHKRYLRCQTNDTQWQQYLNGVQRWLSNIYIVAVDGSVPQVTLSNIHDEESNKLPINLFKENWLQYVVETSGQDVWDEVTNYIDGNYSVCNYTMTAMWEGA
jgi:hypothetical protein